MNAATGDGFHRGNAVLLFGVDDMRRADFLREREARGNDIDGDDRRGANDARRNNRAQPHRADAECREARAGSHFQRVHDRARPSLYAAAEWSEQLQWRIFRHLHDVALVSDRAAC